MHCASCASAPTAFFWAASASISACLAASGLISSALRARGGQHRDDVGLHLNEAAVNVEMLDLVAQADAQFAEAEPADQRRPARQNAQFAVVHRQDDEIGVLVQQRPFGRDHHALQIAERSGP